MRSLLDSSQQGCPHLFHVLCRHGRRFVRSTVLHWQVQGFPVEVVVLLVVV